jgi:phospholipase C
MTLVDPALANLDKIEHIVVLMMENRSFDHMLGYLKHDSLPEIEGLDPDMANTGPDGTVHEVKPLGARLIDQKVLDPGHGKKDVAEQLRNGNGGFVRSYAQALQRNKQKYQYPSTTILDETLVLGYQTAGDVPVYDYLARHFQVCDHWFSSVPGPTWSNRLYSITGGEGEPALPEIVSHLPKQFRNAPIYDRKAFTRWLPDDAWRWYSHDPATLRMIDSLYRPGGEHGGDWDDNFAYFNRKTLLEWSSFLDDAKHGKLRAVSWIDPNFVDFRLYGPPGSNDDHPPSRVMLGQELILQTIAALLGSPQWPKTMLLITYDEHGGFYDHVRPGDFDVPGDPGASYGVRVPALVVSPYVDAGISKTVFDHTSIIKSILLRFSQKPDEALAALGPRTAAANHLGELLTRGEPRRPNPDGDLGELFDAVATWKKKAYVSQLLEEPTLGDRLFEAVTDLQREVIGASMTLREQGVTPDKP